MPRVLALAGARSEASGTCAALSEFRPNEANAIEYDRAAGPCFCRTWTIDR